MKGPVPNKESDPQLGAVEALEKHKIGKAIGSFGGTPRLKGKILNGVFVLMVCGAFVASLFTTGFSQILSIDIGLVLLSLKLAYHLHTEAKVNHAQFWILTTLEDRLLNIISELRGVRKELRDVLTNRDNIANSEKSTGDSLLDPPENGK